jgi:hypothetical protein
MPIDKIGVAGRPPLNGPYGAGFNWLGFLIIFLFVDTLGAFWRFYPLKTHLRRT